MEHVITERSELESVATALIETVKGRGAPFVLLLSGDLGAGKTSLVQEIGKQLGVREHITSPTFVLMKSYPVPEGDTIHTLTHIDLYRIEEEGELTVLTLPELLKDRTRLTCIEWPERAGETLPEHALRVHIALLPDGRRIITYDN